MKWTHPFELRRVVRREGDEFRVYPAVLTSQAEEAVRHMPPGAFHVRADVAGEFALWDGAKRTERPK